MIPEGHLFLFRLIRSHKLLSLRSLFVFPGFGAVIRLTGLLWLRIGLVDLFVNLVNAFFKALYTFSKAFHHLGNFLSAEKKQNHKDDDDNFSPANYKDRKSTRLNSSHQII